MTSVKELGETLRKRQAIESIAPAEEIARGSSGSKYAVVLVIAGCLALALGAAEASLGVIAPELVWMTESLERLGITSGVALGVGTSLLGLGLVARAVALTHRALLGVVRRSGVFAQLAEGHEEMRDSLGRVHFALRVLHESTRGLLEVAHEQSLRRESTEHEDAVYHLAASLDQLGARLEERLGSQQSGFEQRLCTLDAAVEDMRRRIGEWLEEAQRARAASVARAENEGPRANFAERRSRGRADDASRRRSTRSESNGTAGRERPLELSPSERLLLGQRGELDAEPGHSDDELEVLVTLEQHEDAEERRPEPSLPKAPTARHELPQASLGVLDILDDYAEGEEQEREDPTSAAAFLLDEELVERLERMAASVERARAADASSARTEEKLAQLHALLADSGLRRALEELRDREDRRA